MQLRLPKKFNFLKIIKHDHVVFQFYVIKVNNLSIQVTNSTQFLAKLILKVAAKYFLKKKNLKRRRNQQFSGCRPVSVVGKM